MAWCNEKGIPYTTFKNWVNKEASSEEGDIAPAVQWADVTPVAEGTGAFDGVAECPPPPRIRLTSGCFEICVESGFDPKVLAGVLRAVSEVVCC